MQVFFAENYENFCEHFCRAGVIGMFFVENNEKPIENQGFPLAFCAFCHYNIAIILG